jgi:hypothetical protein
MATERKYWITFTGEAEVTVRDDRVILRVTENRDDEDRPEGHPEHIPERAYRKVLYRIDSEGDVLEMLLWNAAANGVRRANRLDGWADLDDEAAEVRIDRIDIDEYSESSESVQAS